MFNVDLLSSVPTKSDKGCSKHGESYPCSYMPYYITVPLLPLSGYEIGQSVDKLLTLLRHTSRCKKYGEGENPCHVFGQFRRGSCLSSREH